MSAHAVLVTVSDQPGMLFGLTPLDPGTFIGVAVLFAVVAAVAASIPAHRATRVDPLVALRTD